MDAHYSLLFEIMQANQVLSKIIEDEDLLAFPSIQCLTNCNRLPFERWVALDFCD